MEASIEAVLAIGGVAAFLGLGWLVVKGPSGGSGMRWITLFDHRMTDVERRVAEKRARAELRGPAD